MRILFIHQNFPGQFVHLAPALAARGHTVVALTINGTASSGVQVLRYQPQRGSTPEIHPWVVDFETKTIRGEACAQAMHELRQQGFVPDVVIAHPGWGEALFVKDIFPQARLVCFLEYAYRAQGADVGFDQEFEQTDWQSDARIRLKNTTNLLTLDALSERDVAYAPTHWQKSSQPAVYHDKIEVIHDGIDTEMIRPDAATRVTVKTDLGERVLTVGDEIVTFVNRNLEPYRGYHIFMRALPKLQKQRPDALTIIVGGDQLSYGKAAPEGKSWKQVFLEEVGDQLDMSRILFTGALPYDAYQKILRISACHVYLTYPFVLSWSMLEAMSTSCLLVASDTAPVREVITHGKNGLLVDFFDHAALANTISDVLAYPQAYQHLRQAARKHVIEHYDLNTVCLPQQIALVEG
ncbi:glycosyltransferase family 4 protein [Undibacterium sp. SXout7W]|uniref:glycosyltransferase family 4 protein n=1 Tax=Undibacterium sp. SXout7W TaxID=3413049 RepID=UPI003BF0DCC1